MNEFWQQRIESLTTDYAAMSPWEPVAVVFALAYLILAMYEKRSCWYMAFVSTTIYTFLFFNVSLVMESALQVYYLLMAVYGWWVWRDSRNETASPVTGSAVGPAKNAMTIHRWSWRQHSIAIVAVMLLTVISGSILDAKTSAALPYWDSFTTWGSVVTTYMVTRKVLENWIYWLVIDGISIFLYLDRGLVLTSVLFVFYEVIVVFGLIRWWSLWKQQNPQPAVALAV